VKIVWIAPGEQNGDIVVIWVVVCLGVDCSLPLAETLECVVGVVADIEPFLHNTTQHNRESEKKGIKLAVQRVRTTP